MRCRCRSTHSSRSARRSSFQSPRLLRQFALHLLDRVAAAMQIGDQPGGLARLRRDQRAGALDDRFAAGPAAAAMAMPLEPPGTPTRSR